MSRGLIGFVYASMALWLAGFAAAAATAPRVSGIAVVCGTEGLLSTLAATVARIGAHDGAGGRTWPSRH